MFLGGNGRFFELFWGKVLGRYFGILTGGGIGRIFFWVVNHIFHILGVEGVF